jgi:hypothetical protein
MQNIFNIKDFLHILIRCNTAAPLSKNIARALADFDLLDFVTNPNAYFRLNLSLWSGEEALLLPLKNKRRSIASFSEGEESPGCTGRRTP